jgi:hypothetical protein
VALGSRQQRGVPGQNLDVPPGRGVGCIRFQPRGAVLVELELELVDDDICPRELAELAQLGVVNAACAGPRRPSTTTSSTCALESASSAWSAVSVGASSSGSSTSIRATSIAALPFRAGLRTRRAVR